MLLEQSAELPGAVADRSGECIVVEPVEEAVADQSDRLGHLGGNPVDADVGGSTIRSAAQAWPVTECLGGHCGDNRRNIPRQGSGTALWATIDAGCSDCLDDHGCSMHHMIGQIRTVIPDSCCGRAELTKMRHVVE